MSLHHNHNSYLFVNGKEICEFKTGKRNVNFPAQCLYYHKIDLSAQCLYYHKIDLSAQCLYYHKIDLSAECLYYHKIDLSKGIDPGKGTDSKECIACHVFLIMGSNFKIPFAIVVMI